MASKLEHAAYHAVEDVDSDGDEGKSFIARQRSFEEPVYSRLVVTLLNLILFVTSIGILSFSLKQAYACNSKERVDLVKMTSTYCG
jgi:hypothetical protein